MLAKKMNKKDFHHFCFLYKIEAKFIYVIWDFQGIDDIDIEDDKREIIHREIKSFRDLHKVGISVD